MAKRAGPGPQGDNSATPRTRDEPHVIRPTAVYTQAGAIRALGLTQSTLRREVRLRRLKVSKRGGKYFFLGEHLLQWVKDGEVGRRSERDALAATSPDAPETADPPSATAPPGLVAAALRGALACAYCAWEAAELVGWYDPHRPDDDPAWRDLLLGQASGRLADLQDAVLDGVRLIPSVVPALARGCPQSVKVRLPADPVARLPQRVCTKATAHETALELAARVLQAIWRSADPDRYGQTSGLPGGSRAFFQYFDPAAAAERLPTVWKELVAVLPHVDLPEINAACAREASRLEGDVTADTQIEAATEPASRPRHPGDICVEARRALWALAEGEGVSKTEAMERAIRRYAWKHLSEAQLARLGLIASPGDALPATSASPPAG